MRSGLLGKQFTNRQHDFRLLSQQQQYQGLWRLKRHECRKPIDQKKHSRLIVTAASTLPRAPSGLSNIPWTNSHEQLRALEQLKQRTKNFPGGQPEEDMLRWFLRDRGLNVEEAAEKLRKTAAWRQRVRPDALSEDDVVHQLSTGKGYMHDHLDVAGRPVLVVRVAKHFPDGRGEPEASRTFCAYLMESALQKLPPGGETVLGIFDFQGAGAQNIDLDFAKFLVDMFFTYYPKRLGQVLMVDAPWGFQPPWQLIKPLLRKYAALVKFVSSEDVQKDFFTPKTCPKDFQR